MAQELFFEIRRRQMHMYVDAEETQTVLDLKKMVAGITNQSTQHMELWKLDDDNRKTQILHDTATLVDCGFTSINAKAQQPAPLGLRITTSDETVEIAEVSTPPPIPDTMRADPAPQD